MFKVITFDTTSDESQEKPYADHRVDGVVLRGARHRHRKPGMPLIQDDFRLANDEIQRVQTLYILFYGALLLVGGKLADATGRRGTFVIGNALFLVTSFGAALSFRFDMLVAFRAIQGIGAALMLLNFGNGNLSDVGPDSSLRETLLEP